MAKTAVRRALDNSRRARRHRAFEPYKAPERPPAGTYDPSLDYQQDQAQRGYEDLQADTARDLERGSNDYTLASGQVGYQTGSALADLMQRRSRGDEDAAASTAERQRQYAIQAARQREAANAAGLLGSSGWDEQAAGIRGANQAREQGAQDLAVGRQNADLSLAGERTQYAGAQQQGQLDLGWGRATADAQQTLQRAGRENTFFGQATNAARMYGATSSGLWEPPQKPPGERRIAGTGRYIHKVPGGAILQGGRAITNAQLAAMRRREIQRRQRGG